MMKCIVEFHDQAQKIITSSLEQQKITSKTVLEQMQLLMNKIINFKYEVSNN